jgi:hypothetical protein
MDVLRAAGSLVLAAEAITSAGKSAEAAARAALAHCMAETGCPAVALEHHTVHLGTKPAAVEIEDAQLLPSELMRCPAPAPDKIAIGKRLQAGDAIPGARLIASNAPICIFKGKSQ